MLTKQIYDYIQKLHMIPEKATVLCGVSGGADSTALLLILSELREKMDFTLEVIHVEHGIRGEESQMDQHFVEALCEELQVPCRVYPVDVPAFAAEQNLGLEEAARLLRYRIFARRAAETGGRIALAHHRNDQAETFLFSLVRGSGVKGLGGMEPVRRDGQGILYIRPLLQTGRQEIEDFLRERGQNYCTDATNADIAYSRNRIRNRILPQLEEINPRAVRHIAEAAEVLRETENYMNEQAAAAYEACRLREEQEEEYPVLKAEKLLEFPSVIRRRVLKMALEEACGHQKDLEAVHIEALEKLLAAQSGRKLDLPYQVRALREYSLLRFEAVGTGLPVEGASPAEEKFTVTAEELANLMESAADSSGTGNFPERSQTLPGEILNFPGGSLTFRTFSFSGNFAEIPQKQYTKWLDYDKIKNGFSIRHRQSGDFLIIDGEMHHQKLKTYLNGARIPAGERDRIWLLADDSRSGAIIWVIGGRISEAYRITGKTKYILEIEFTGA